MTDLEIEPERPRSLRAPLALTFIIALTFFFATSPLRGIGGGAPVPAAVRLSPLYIALAPWCNLLDTLSLISARQHVASLVTLH